MSEQNAAQRLEETQQAERKRRILIDDLRSAMRYLDPPLDVDDAFTDMLPRLKELPEGRHLQDDTEAFQIAFERFMKRLKDRQRDRADSDHGRRRRERRDSVSQKDKDREREREERRAERRRSKSPHPDQRDNKVGASHLKDVYTDECTHAPIRKLVLMILWKRVKCNHEFICKQSLAMHVTYRSMKTFCLLKTLFK